MNDKVIKNGGRLSGLCAIVTGGGSGIGRATCRALALEGASVAVADIHEDKALETSSGLETADGARGSIHIGVDVRVEAELQEMVSRTVEAYGRVDILVHCAGILRGEGNAPRLMHEISAEEMHNVIDTNVKGTFFTNRAVLPEMIKRGSGRIINIASTSGIKGRAFDSVYCASKHAVVGLSESLAEEVMRLGVKVQTLLPDAVDTPLWDQNGPVRAPENSLSPERVANLIVYMLALPEDVILQNIIIAPFKTRKRKKRVPVDTGDGGSVSGGA